MLRIKLDHEKTKITDESDKSTELIYSYKELHCSCSYKYPNEILFMSTTISKSFSFNWIDGLHEPHPK